MRTGVLVGLSLTIGACKSGDKPATGTASAAATATASAAATGTASATGAASAAAQLVFADPRIEKAQAACWVDADTGAVLRAFPDLMS